MTDEENKKAEPVVVLSDFEKKCEREKEAALKAEAEMLARSANRKMREQ